MLFNLNKNSIVLYQQELIILKFIIYKDCINSPNQIKATAVSHHDVLNVLHRNKIVAANLKCRQGQDLILCRDMVCDASSNKHLYDIVFLPNYSHVVQLLLLISPFHHLLLLVSKYMMKYVNECH